MKAFIPDLTIPKHIFFVLMVFMHSFINAQQPIPKVDEVVFTSLGTIVQTKNLYVNGTFDPANCVSKTLKNSDFNLLFDLGDDYDLGNCSFNAELKVEVKAYTSGFPSPGTLITSAPFGDPLSVILKVSNDKPEQLYNVSFASFHSQIILIEVNVLPVTISSSTCYTAVSNRLRVKAFYTENFGYGPTSIIYPTVPMVTLLPVASPCNANPVTFQWQTNCPEIKNFQFQLLRLFNDQEANPDPSDEYDVQALVDWSKALSIETQSPVTSITLTVAEGKGFYIWRVRPVGNLYEGGIANALNWGLWNSSSPADAATETFTNVNVTGYRFFYEQFDEKKNWIYSRTFTEGNPEQSQGFRVSEQITYANGLQQVRQTQTHLMSADKVLASQTVQDFSGRPALTTMAAPLKQSSAAFQDYLQYKPKLIIDHQDSNKLYTANDFDKDANFQNPSTIFAGDIADYYSSMNGDVTIPDAQKYTFSRTLFERDGTNRVKEQGGVGPVHRIGGSGGGLDRTTKTFYGGVANVELVRVFGDEAPADTSVYKVINIDANKTTSVNYISKEGQTIATCLSKPSSTLLEPLTLPAGLPFDVMDTLKASTPFGENGITSTKTVVLTEPSNSITYYYTITPAVLSALCNGQCKTCDYKIYFLLHNVSDPDATIVYDGVLTSFPIVEPLTIPSDVCSAAIPNPQTPIVFSGLGPGTYMVERRVLTGNVDPLSPTGQTYLDERIDVDTTAIRIQINTSLAAIFTNINDNDVVGLNTTLLGMGKDTTLNSATINTGCCDITIPIYHCGAPEDCPAGFNQDFEKYLFDTWGTKYGTTPNNYFYEHGKPMYPPQLSVEVDMFGLLFGNYDGVVRIEANNLATTPGTVLLIPILSPPGLSSASNIANAINAFSFQHHFTAIANGSNLIVNAGMGSGAITGSKITFRVYKNNFPFDDFQNRDVAFLPSANAPFPNGTGAFNAMIGHMLDETIGGNKVYSCSKLFACWKGIVDSYELFALRAGTTVRNYDFNLMDAFLQCVQGDCRGYEGISDCPYGTCGTGNASGGTYGMGNLEYAYKYFRYDALNRSLYCEGSLATNSSLYNLSISPPTSTVSLVNLAAKQISPWTVSDGCSVPYIGGQVNPTPMQNQPWMQLKQCISSAKNTLTSIPVISGCETNPPDNACLDAMEQAAEDTCKSVCESRYHGFVSSLIALYHSKGILVYGHDPAAIPSDINIDEIYCTARTLVDECKSGCQLTRYTDGVGQIHIGTNAELDAMKQSMVYGYELDLPLEDGTCSSGFSKVQGTANTKDMVLKYLNTKLEEFRQNAPANGADMNIYDILNVFDPALLASCGITSGTTVFVQPDAYSYFEVRDCDSDGSGGGMKASSSAQKLSPPENTFNICLGESITLTAGIPTPWTWNTGDLTQSITLSFNATGTFSYFVTSNYFGNFIEYFTVIVEDCDAQENCCLFYNEFPSFRRGPDIIIKAEIRQGNLRETIGFGKTFSEPPSVRAVQELKKGEPALFTIENVTTDSFDIVVPDTMGYMVDVEVTEQRNSRREASIPSGTVMHSIEFGDTITKLSEVHILQTDGLTAVANVCSTSCDLIASDTLGREAKLILLENRTDSGMVSMEEGEQLKMVAFSEPFLEEPIVRLLDMATSLEIKSVSRDGFMVVSPNKEEAQAGFEAISRTRSTSNLICQDICSIKNCNAICIRWFPLSDIPITTNTSIFTLTSCEQQSMNAISNAIESQVAKCKEQRAADLKEQYKNTCLNPANINDLFKFSYQLGYHHYTLYYYDRAGNLVRTVPPAGIKFTDVNSDALVDRETQHTDHSLKTEYAYNSMKQLVRQKTPDGGETFFVYDNKGQLRFSQNAQQKIEGSYSYTKYDNLGRIIEVGKSSLEETTNGNTADFTDENIYSDYETEAQNNPDFPSSNANANSEITVTVYSLNIGINYNPVSSINLPQRFTQNRISFTFTEEDGNFSTNDDRVFSAYSYDPHGNVEWMRLFIPELGDCYIRYEYDLVSNKVLKVIYNEGRSDQFMHRYKYDEDNRIVQAETSRDGTIWERDARYNYYAHGPLKRTVIGEDKVQGMDNIYTLQGWLKAVNFPIHVGFNSGQDPGQDGYSGSNVGRDAFGMLLGYYSGDFVHSSSPFSSTFNNLPQPAANNNQLFNGNISVWTSNTDFNAIDPNLTVNNTYKQRTAEVFRYDELNRIKNSNFFYSSSGNNSFSGTDDYLTQYSYDGNGNILSLFREGYGSVNQRKMDDMQYQYYSGNNRLKRITDTGDNSDGARYNDMRNQNQAENYLYDATGNLKTDKQANRTIQWNVYGKVKKVGTGGFGAVGGKPDIRFTYGPQGNRVIKKLTFLTGNNQPETTYYVRDAQGNVMAIYEKKAKGKNFEYSQVEVPIYGSSRIGEYKPKRLVIKTEPLPSECTGCKIGQKDVVITEVLYDSPLTKDNVNNPNNESNFGEFMVIKNVSGKEVSLANVELRNNNNNQKLQFDATEKLQPEKSMVIAYGTASQKQDLMTTDKLDAVAANDASLQWKWQTTMKLHDNKASLELVEKGTQPNQLNSIDKMEYDQNALKAKNDYVADVNDPSRVKPGSVQREFFDPGNDKFDPAEFKIDKVNLKVDPIKISPIKIQQPYTFTRQLGEKVYELNDHLGNTRVLVSDRKLSTISGNNPTNFTADLLAYNSYYPFGMLAPARNAATDIYRYAYNSKEYDSEWNNKTGAMYDYGFRIYDPRVGRFLSVDPLFREYPYFSSYVFAGNQVIHSTDLEGLEPLDELGVGDNKGAIRSSSKLLYETDPVKAGIVDGSYILATLMGLNIIDNLLDDWKSEDLSTNEKVNATIDAASEMMTPSRGPIKGKSPNKPQISQPKFKTTKMLGEKGTQIKSLTLWRSKESKARIDVENPAPGKREGQIHYQDADNTKFIYNPSEKKFFAKDPKTGKFEVEAPKKVNSLLKEKEIQGAIEKGLKYLGEEMPKQQ